MREVRPTPFVYPAHPHVRRHGPSGWHYSKYRDWLRDEFHFRCVFCLHRETWEGRDIFEIDHHIPQNNKTGRPELRDVYDNLLYVCRGCNKVKDDLTDVPNPCEVAFGDCVEVADDGAIHARNEAGQLLIDLLRLNEAKLRAFRKAKIEDTQESRAGLVRTLRFPDELPDLAGRKQPPKNTRPEGLQHTCHARKQRGELPHVY